MSSPAPLLIIVGTIVILILIQQLLSRSGMDATAAVSDNGKSGSRISSSQLFSGLTVNGLNAQEINRLQELIIAGNLPELAIFLVFHKASVPELDRFLEQVRHKLLAIRSQGSGGINQTTLKTLLDPSILPKPPAGIRFDVLNDDDHLHVLSFEPKSPRIITRDFMLRFGAHTFQRHFLLYSQYKKPVLLNIPDDDPKRPMFEKLAESGITEKGSKIGFSQRLTLLSLKQLKQMAKDLNLNLPLSNKAEAIKSLANIPGSRVLFSLQYAVDDLFYLMPTSENSEQVLHEWGFLNAYAKLLCGIADKTLPSSI